MSQGNNWGYNNDGKGYEEKYECCKCCCKPEKKEEPKQKCATIKVCIQEEKKDGKNCGCH